MPLAVRRLALRFDILGRPCGILAALEPLRVRKLSPDGMLLESRDPLAVGSSHEFQLIDGKTSVRVRAAVRRLRPSSDEQSFLVGLEFVNLNPRSSVVVERWLSGQWTQRAPRGA